LNQENMQICFNLTLLDFPVAQDSILAFEREANLESWATIASDSKVTKTRRMGIAHQNRLSIYN